MALPNGLAQVSDLGALLSTLGNDLVDIPLMQPTAVTGSPAAGYFYSSITNRAPMYDLRKDLSVNMGPNRIQTQQIYEIQNEFGPNGERIWGAVNDTYGQIRFVGSWSGGAIASGTDGFGFSTGAVNDFLEITFYGTGLNLLISRMQTAGTSWSVSINGGGTSTVVAHPSTGAPPLTGRNYAENIVIPVVSNLTLGLYTVKILCPNGTTGVIMATGFEILNESSSIKVNPGTTWKQGKKLYNPSQAISSYNSGFESGTLGTRGGRVIVYQKADGSIAKAVNPTNTSSATLSSADHSNEEVARAHYWREFGAGKSDDFSTSTLTATSRAFTLDDGTTTLVGATNINSESVFNYDGLYAQNGSTITLTFVGTGLDILFSSSGARNTNISIDGGTAVNIVTSGGTAPYVQKIVSGLPYGTHTIRIIGNGTAALSIIKFIIYQPKTPTLPSGASQIGAYNVMADYANDTSLSEAAISPGTLIKTCARELVYVGTWLINAVNGTWTTGFNTYTTTNNDYFEYTFFGTGIELRTWFGSTSTYNMTCTVDGLALNAGSNIGSTVSIHSAQIGSMTISAAGVVSGTSGAGSGYGSKIRISGLSLGEHKLKVVRNSITGGDASMYVSGLNVITPIHSPKDNGPFIVQNTLAIGSQGISDSRLLAENINAKNSCRAIGISTNHPVTATLPTTPLIDMSTTIYVKKNRKLKINCDAILTQSNASAVVDTMIFLNGQRIAGTLGRVQSAAAGINGNTTSSAIVQVASGYHKIDAYFWVNVGTGNIVGAERCLNVEEID